MFTQLYGLKLYNFNITFKPLLGKLFLQTYITYLRILILRHIGRRNIYSHYIYAEINYIIYRRSLIQYKYLWISNYVYLYSRVKGRGTRMGKGSGTTFIRYIWFYRNSDGIKLRYINIFLLQYLMKYFRNANLQCTFGIFNYSLNILL